MTRAIDPRVASARDCLASARRLVGRGNEQRVRDSLTSYLRTMFPESPPWLGHLIEGAEAPLRLARRGRLKGPMGFVDNLVNATAIEFESDISAPAKRREGEAQVREYCGACIRELHFTPSQVRGVLSDTVRWLIFGVSVRSGVAPAALTAADIVLEPIEEHSYETRSAGEGEHLIQLLTRACSRVGDRALTAEHLVDDLGLDGLIHRRCRPGIEATARRAFRARREYRALIESLWAQTVGFLDPSTGGFSRRAYLDELYLCTVAKMVAASVLRGGPRELDREALASILDGRWFRDRHRIANLVEYDYFGWLNAEPHVGGLVDVAAAIQEDLVAYDFSLPPAPDLFGRLMASLADRTKRRLLGQESTPPWLATRLVTRALGMLPKGQSPRFVDPCCGSGTLVTEVVRQVARTLPKRVRPDEALRQLRAAATGFDLDPVATMLAKVSWIIAARDHLRGSVDDVTVPIFQADSLRLLTPILGSDPDPDRVTLDLGGHRVRIPRQLFSARLQPAFDALLDAAYASATGELITADDPLMAKALAAAERRGAPRLDPRTRESVIEGMTAVARAIQELSRAGRNGLWVFMLRNACRPEFVQGQFNGVVSNPPWYDTARDAKNRYIRDIEGLSARLRLRPRGPSSHHRELAVTFLIHAVEHFLADGGVVACIMPDPVLNGNHCLPFRVGAYRRADRQHLRVTALWEVAPDAFKNRAVVVLGEKSATSTTPPIPGQRVSAERTDDLVYSSVRSGSGLVWSTSGSSGSGVRAISLEQGADVMPRSLFVVTVSRAGTRRHIEALDPADPAQGFVMQDAKEFPRFRRPSRTVTPAMLFRLWISKLLTPFHVASDAAPWALLPIRRTSTGVRRLDDAEIDALGDDERRAIGDIVAVMRRSPKPKYRRGDLWAILDYHNKLRRQVFDPRAWYVLMGTGGGIPCAAAAPGALLRRARVVIDQTLNYGEMSGRGEADYVVAMLNHEWVASRVLATAPRGMFGPRHVHSRPFQHFAPYAPGDPRQRALVVATRRLMRAVAADPAIARLRGPGGGTPLHARRASIRRCMQALAEFAAYDATARPHVR